MDSLTTKQGVSNSRRIDNYADYANGLLCDNYADYTNGLLCDVINLSAPFLQAY